MAQPRTIENVAKILLSNRIAFTYSENFLKVNNDNFAEMVFQTAIYNDSKKELFLFSKTRNIVHFDTFLGLISIYKNYN